MTKSIKAVARREFFNDKRAREAARTARDPKKVGDSMQNFAAGLGIGTDNLMSATTYGFNPISRIRTELEWIHRGSWLGGVAVDLVADDMTREGVEIKGDMDPEDIEEIQQAAVELGIWNQINDTIRWSRLYGGAIGAWMVEGQDMKTPLRLETIGKDQFRGLLVLDRWMVDTSLEDLVTDMGPNIGMPKYYTVNTSAPVLNGKKIHYSRVIRLEGIRLPYWQRLQENMWGISILERLYDRMVAFDSATTGAAQLVFKSYLRTYKIKDMREIVSAGGPALTGLLKTIQFMRQQQSIEGITLLDGTDEFDVHGTTAFSGIGEALTQFAQQIAGALQIPLTRLLGQSPAGLNATGESDIRTYYDGIAQQQNHNLLSPVNKIFRAIAQSLGKKPAPNYGVVFRPLWKLTEIEKSTIAKEAMETVTSGVSSGLISDQVALKELKQSSAKTGMMTNISDEDINKADDEPAPPIGELLPGEGGEEGEDEGAAPPKKKGKATDSALLCPACFNPVEPGKACTQDH